jgi:hypothetical protein
MSRLAAKLEATGIVRRVEAEGGFATILRRGDPERGSLVLVVSSRGRHLAFLERVLDIGGDYRWQRVGPDESANPEKVADFLAKRARFDEDLWAIELDIAEPERFIAETIGLG